MSIDDVKDGACQSEGGASRRSCSRGRPSTLKRRQNFGPMLQNSNTCTHNHPLVVPRPCTQHQHLQIHQYTVTSKKYKFIYTLNLKGFDSVSSFGEVAGFFLGAGSDGGSFGSGETTADGTCFFLSQIFGQIFTVL